jgi:hypothetical protein
MAVKLDWDTVQEIRRQHAAGLPYSKIAAKCGISNQWAIAIVKRRGCKGENTQPAARQGV